MKKPVDLSSFNEFTNKFLGRGAGGPQASELEKLLRGAQRVTDDWLNPSTTGEVLTADQARDEVAGGLANFGMERTDALAEADRIVERAERRVAASPVNLDIEPANADGGGRRARIIRVGDVEPETINWLWASRLARGKITLLAGDPGAGKTYLALAISAALSRGAPLPGEATGREPCSVVYLTREDGVGDTLRPRLDSLGADVDRVVVLDGAQDGEAVGLGDVDVIGDAIEHEGAALIVVDPIQSWLGARIDAHRANETRPVLDALGKLCERHRCACLIVAHMAKAQAARAVTAALGSIDFAGAARVMLIAAADPRDPTTTVVAGAKSNIGPMPASIAYKIDRDKGGFTWIGETDASAQDILGADSGGSDARDEAVEWLRSELAYGPKPASEMARAAHNIGISPSTLRRARSALRVRSRRRGFGPGAAYVWELPDTMLVIDAQVESMDIHDKHGDIHGADDIERGVI